jgi:hypothetical protein
MAMECILANGEPEGTSSKQRTGITTDISHFNNELTFFYSLTGLRRNMCTHFCSLTTHTKPHHVALFRLPSAGLATRGRPTRRRSPVTVHMSAVRTLEYGTC